MPKTKHQEVYPIKLKEPCYMMATKAWSKGNLNISKSTPSLCFVDREDEDNYIGNWLEGAAWIDVKFPKKTTRKLTKEEKDKHNGTVISVGSYYTYIVETKKNPIPKTAFNAVVKNAVLRFSKADKDEVRTISSNKESLPFKKCRIIFLSVGKGIKLCSPNIKKMFETTKVISIE